MLMRMGGAIAAIAMLAVLGMSVSGMVALSTQGSGEAINLAGSLRMQSWKLTSIYLSWDQDRADAQRQQMRQAITTFENILEARPIMLMLPGSGELDLAASYARVRDAWQQRMRPRFASLASDDPSPPTRADGVTVTAEVSRFVDDIHYLVKQMERATEAKIQTMQLVLGAALAVTVLVLLLTVYLINTGLVQPLRDLLACTSRMGQGDLSVRTEYTGEDELGRLGQAFNLMAGDLSKLYHDLESRVEQKTAELTRSNHSLELLSHSIARMHGAPPGRETYVALLHDVESVLGVGHGIICLGERGSSQGQVVASTMESGVASPCDRANCVWCHSTDSPRASITPEGRQLLSLPLSDAERQYGMLLVELPPGMQPQAWQVQLLEALSRHIGVAIAAEQRIELSRRLGLLEERAVIARELHDSLAQSLAYMKIQVSRLQMALREPDQEEEVDLVLQELREGLNGAYRQLRELLSTFRLKMDGQGLDSVLAQTVEEFSDRGGLNIRLDNLPEHCPLTPNEEIHVLHIIREAMSNVMHHAQAHNAWIRLACRADGIFDATVEDDGIGIRKSADVHHYGMTIMEERARTLHGDIRYEERPEGGTRVVLSFKPTRRRTVVPIRRVAA